jgi:hypothetical protein
MMAPTELIIIVIVLLVILIAPALWVYKSLAFKKIAQKAKLKTPNLAWIPFIGPWIISYQSSNMHFWPWFLLIGLIIPFLNYIFILAFIVFLTIWRWKMFEKIGHPNWWSILFLIPLIGSLIYLVLIGVAAWSKGDIPTKK